MNMAMCLNVLLVKTMCRLATRFHKELLSLAGLALLQLGLVSPAASQADNFLPFNSESFAAIKEHFAGSEFLLGLWSVDCPPCLVELDMMGELLEKNPDLPFVLVSTDSIDDRESALEFLEEFNLHERQSYMFADSFTERLRYSIDPNWFGELPRSYFFDPQHNMQSHSGIMTIKLLRRWFSRNLKL